MKDRLKLIDHLTMGTPYHSDVARDTIEFLEDPELPVDDYNEVIASLPEEDELSEIINLLSKVHKTKTLKADMFSTISKAISMLEQKQFELTSSAEHIQEYLEN